MVLRNIVIFVGIEVKVWGEKYVYMFFFVIVIYIK